MGKLQGKVALVTGAGRGIGREIALKLASEGAHLVVNDLDHAPLEDVVASIAEMGRKAAPVAGNVAADDFGERFVGKAISDFGGVDIIVNNAGYTWDNVIHKMSDEQWRAVMDVHVTAPFRILRAASEFIRIAAKKEAQAGAPVYRKVVNISSIAGLYGNAGQANYSAAKAALVGLTRTMAKEWGRYNVNVNCVAFGAIETRLTQPLSKDGQAQIRVDDRDINVGVQPHTLEMLRTLVPLGRMGTPQEAAGSIYMFCIPESDYVSGQILVCGGGLLM